jgi:hypothetical protein
MGVAVCPNCFEKQQRIDQLEQENQRLKQQLRYRQRQAEQGFFGSSTPSSKVALKANTADANRSDPGGLKAGHPAARGRPDRNHPGPLRLSPLWRPTGR